MVCLIPRKTGSTQVVIEICKRNPGELQMAFERFEKQTHTVAEVIVYVSYDRFTTRFEIKTEYEVIYSSLVLFFIKKSKLSINGKSFVLKIFWLIFWKSQLVNAKGIVVEELLYRRRNRAIGQLFFLVLLITINTVFSFTA